MRIPNVAEFVRLRSSAACLVVAKRSKRKEDQSVVLRDEEGTTYELKDCWVPRVGDRVNAYRYVSATTIAEIEAQNQTPWGGNPHPKAKKLRLWGNWEMVIVRVEGDRCWVSTLAFTADHVRDMRFAGVEMPLTHIELAYESEDMEGFVFKPVQYQAKVQPVQVQAIAEQGFLL